VGKGLRIAVLPETPVSYWLGTHEPETQDALRHLLAPGMTVYDCGANVGYFTAICARLVTRSGRVYAFEPSPKSVACLRRVAELNGFANVEVVPRAVWRSTGIVEFSSGPGGAALVSDHVAEVLSSLAGGSRFRVPAVSLDQFVFGQGHPAPDLVKLDVEGSETAALQGAERLLRERRPLLLVEVHGDGGRGAWEILRDIGYRCQDVASGIEPRTVEEFAVWLRLYLAIPPGEPR
jgi:FkbM family methyltransferase